MAACALPLASCTLSCLNLMYNHFRPGDLKKSVGWNYAVNNNNYDI